jgi:hypothetical protein
VNCCRPHRSQISANWRHLRPGTTEISKRSINCGAEIFDHYHSYLISANNSPNCTQNAFRTITVVADKAVDNFEKLAQPSVGVLEQLGGQFGQLMAIQVAHVGGNRLGHQHQVGHVVQRGEWEFWVVFGLGVHHKLLQVVQNFGWCQLCGRQVIPRRGRSIRFGRIRLGLGFVIRLYILELLKGLRCLQLQFGQAGSYLIEDGRGH